MASPGKKAFLLRLPPEVWAQLERLAAAELRSVNGQIEYMLRQALAKRVGHDASSAQTETTVSSADAAGRIRRAERQQK